MLYKDEQLVGTVENSTKDRDEGEHGHEHGQA
jgi:hypothetical protein